MTTADDLLTVLLARYPSGATTDTLLDIFADHPESFFDLAYLDLPSGH